MLTYVDGQDEAYKTISWYRWAMFLRSQAARNIAMQHQPFLCRGQANKLFHEDFRSSWSKIAIGWHEDVLRFKVFYYLKSL